MIKLLKYLKPFVFLIIMSIILLFAQAMADLTLPDYMSNIVNVGIQQGGIENAVPKAITQSNMDKISLFVTAEEKSEILDSYALFDNSSPDYANYLKDYPRLQNEPVYILKKIDSQQTDKISPLIGKALLAVTGLEQIISDPSKAAAMGSIPGFDLSKIPKGTTADQVFSMLEKLPADKLAIIQAAINKKFGSMDAKMISQSAVGIVRNEYSRLGMDTSKTQRSYIMHTGLLMLLLSLVSAACTVLVGYLSAKAAAGLSKNLRKMVFTKVENFSNAEFDKFSTASLITRSTNDITQVQMLVIIMIRMIFYAPIMAIGGIMRALAKSASMSWIIAVAVITLLSLILVVFSITLPKFKIIQSLIDRLSLVTRENLSGMMVIRAFNTQKFEEGRFDRANTDLTRTSLFINRIMITMMPVMMLLMNGLTLLIIWVGAHKVALSHIQVGDVMAFLQYAMLIIISFLMLSIMFIMVPRASVSAGRVAEVLQTESLVRDPLVAKELGGSINGMVQFQNVSFRYPEAEEDALYNIDFTAMPGQTTAFIGPTGSGKSTLANLILRFYDVTGGRIMIDNTDIRDVTQHDLRRNIGYVPQKSVLFSGTIDSNLRYADENADEDTIKNAVAIAQGTEIINEKSEGFDAEIAQGGKNISGGQNQRLSIARALVKKPRIIILDDCFSALDFKTDTALRKALKANFRDSTILIVAQRVGTVMKAEQIIVLDEGRIVGKGTHKELMQTCQTYQEIALSQLSREELA
jgi:ATP-binding cassette, subfamily B, multidrug efflux pump